MVKLLVEESPLVLSPSLASAIGLCEAVVLQQIHYWLNSNSGQIIDGIRWIYNRLDDWLQQFPWLSKWQLRVVMKRLRDELKVLRFEQHEKKEYKRRGWYTIDYEMLNNLLHTSKCDMSTLRDESSSHLKVSDFHTSEEQKITPEKTSLNSLQDSAAVGENDLEEVDWDALENQVARWEEEQLTSEQPVEEEQARLVSNQEESDQSTDTLCVDKQTSVNSSNESIIHEDNCSVAPPKVKTITTSSRNKPSREEINEVSRELRSLRVNPDACMSVIVSNWGNVRGAIAYLKEALQKWKEVKSPIAVFKSACQKGLKAEETTTAIGFNEWFDWARKQRIALASMTISDVHSVMLASDEWIPTTKAMEMYPNASASPFGAAVPQAAEMES